MTFQSASVDVLQALRSEPSAPSKLYRLRELPMKHKRLTALVATCATIAIVTFISSRKVHGESPSKSTNESATQSAAVPIYNPYPQGILPSNIDSEIERVRREENGVEREAINAWLALTPPTVTGNPPIQQNFEGRSESTR